VSYVTVSGVWKGYGKGVTCNGFWAWGGTKEKVSHVTVSDGFGGIKEKVSHVTVSGV
jgi:hypothetical protein